MRGQAKQLSRRAWECPGFRGGPAFQQPGCDPATQPGCSRGNRMEVHELDIRSGSYFFLTDGFGAGSADLAFLVRMSSACSLISVRSRCMALQPYHSE